MHPEQSRASMSVALQSDVGWRPDETIAALDARCRDPSAASSQEMVMGPFAVFGLQSDAPAPTVTLGVPSGVESGFDGSNLASMDGLTYAPTNDSFDTLLGAQDLLDWQDLFHLDSISPDSLSLFFDDSTGRNNEPNLSVQLGPSQQSIGTNVSNSVHYGLRNTDESQLDSSSAAYAWTDAPAHKLNIADAQRLLRDFKQTVIPQIRPMPTSKRTTWEVMHLEFAMLSLAQITYMDSQMLSHSAFANLYAILAIAARQLGNFQPGEVTAGGISWERFADECLEKAKENLKQSLRTEYQGPSAAKYKHQVMAIESLLIQSVSNSCLAQVEAHVLTCFFRRSYSTNSKKPVRS